MAALINWSIPHVHCPWKPIIINTAIGAQIFSSNFGFFCCGRTLWYNDNISFLYFWNYSEDKFKFCEISIVCCFNITAKNRAKSETGYLDIIGDNKSIIFSFLVNDIK